ncbi:MAG: DUF3368 domain-containing protein, partial [Nanoarchaeota archaeon]
MIISNASPLIYLAKINKLGILKKLYGNIIVPEEVYNEIVINGKEGKFHDAIKVENAFMAGWIKIEKTENRKEIEKFAPEIDIGEIAVINLALKLKPDLILMDDASARTIAESFGFNVKGTLYVLLSAYKKRMIEK